MLGEMFQGALHFGEKLIRHFSSEAVANEYALDDEIFAVGRQGISGNKPASLTQSIGKTVEREVRRCGIPSKAPGFRRARHK